MSLLKPGSADPLVDPSLDLLQMFLCRLNGLGGQRLDKLLHVCSKFSFAGLSVLVGQL